MLLPAALEWTKPNTKTCRTMVHAADSHGPWPVVDVEADVHPSPRVDHVRRRLRSFVQTPQDVLEQAVREELTTADIVFLTHVLVASIPTVPQPATILSTNSEVGAAMDPEGVAALTPPLAEERPRPSTRADVLPSNHGEATGLRTERETYVLVPVPHPPAPAHRGRSRSAPPRRKGGGNPIHGKGKGRSASVSRPAMPRELRHLEPTDDQGHRLCWGFNLCEPCSLPTSGSPPECIRGLHTCMACGSCEHGALECPTQQAL